MTDSARRLTRGAAAAVAALIVLADMRPARADAPEWIVDTAKSSIGFTGRQMGVHSKGRFKSFTAKVRFDPGDLAASAVEVTVDAASADAGNPDIDKELKQPKWFDVARFPTVRFETTAFRAKGQESGGKGEYEAVARLTIRNVTEEVVLPFKLDIGPDPSDPGQLEARMTGALTISRTKFGVGRDEWRDTKIVGDNVDLHIDVLARRKK
jgi:polyisoprenoid-binding protein YceI